MHAIVPFLTALARSNGIAFLAAFGVFVLFIAPFIWRTRRAERRYLLQPGTNVPASGEPGTPGRVEHTDCEFARQATYTSQEGGQDGITRLSARQPTGIPHV